MRVLQLVSRCRSSPSSHGKRIFHGCRCSTPASSSSAGAAGARCDDSPPPYFVVPAKGLPFGNIVAAPWAAVATRQLSSPSAFSKTVHTVRLIHCDTASTRNGISTASPSPGKRSHRQRLRFRRCFSATTGRKRNAGDDPASDDSASKAAVVGDEAEGNEDTILYESPLGNLVTRLRTVSLVTGIIGSVGLPAVVALKGGQLPSTGFLALGMAFCAGTIGSTVLIHYVFHPYVYEISLIPVRKCHFKKPDGGDNDDGIESCSSKSAAAPKTATTTKSKDTLYKATSRSLFLTKVETVFDVKCDVQPYKGMRPLCNFTAKGLPLYVHPEYLFNPELRAAMKLVDGKKKKNAVSDKDDDDFF